MKKRWYDLDPTLSLAVSLMGNAKLDLQYKCADMIVNKAKISGLDLSESILTDSFTYVLRRWYDADHKLSESFDYLKLMPEDLQKEVAIEIIAFLHKEEAKK